MRKLRIDANQSTVKRISATGMYVFANQDFAVTSKLNIAFSSISHLVLRNVARMFSVNYGLHEIVLAKCWIMLISHSLVVVYR